MKQEIDTLTDKGLLSRKLYESIPPQGIASDIKIKHELLHKCLLIIQNSGTKNLTNLLHNIVLKFVDQFTKNKRYIIILTVRRRFSSSCWYFINTVLNFSDTWIFSYLFQILTIVESISCTRGGNLPLYATANQFSLQIYQPTFWRYLWGRIHLEDVVEDITLIFLIVNHFCVTLM